MIEILPEAIFISDAHEAPTRRDFWQFLHNINTGKIQTTQLFLMGDIFDLLIGQIDKSVEFAKPYISLLEDLADEMEIYYFEGNHDFNLAKLFKKVHVFPLSSQPVLASMNGKIIQLSHGDNAGKISYKIYTFVIRNPGVLKCLNILDKACKSKLTKSIISLLSRKNICKKIENFSCIIDEKYTKNTCKNVDCILEGHYHQNQEFMINDIFYKNFSSFACERSYFVVKSTQGMQITEQKLRG